MTESLPHGSHTPPAPTGASGVYLTPKELKARWKISAQTLWRLQRRKVVRPIHLTARSVRYALAEVLAAEQGCTGASEAGCSSTASGDAAMGATPVA